jgi:DNA-binding transcriptional MerR regulator
MNEQPNEYQYTRIIIQDGSTTYYTEQEAAEFCRLEVQIIRQLSEVGVLSGIEVVGEERRYSNEDIALLRRVRRLYHDLGVNLEGVEVILRLYTRLEMLQRELEQYRRGNVK